MAKKRGSRTKTRGNRANMRAKRAQRTEAVLKDFAIAAANAQREADSLRALATAVATLVVSPDAPPGSSSNNTGDKQGLDDQLDALRDFLDSQPQWLGNSQCRDILEGMADAVRIGDALGAARAMASYINCMRRPRPKIVTPGPGSSF